MPPVLTDPVYLCARAYQDMIDAEIAFQVEIISKSKIQKFEIKPLDSEFKHLTGVQHLNDIQYQSETLKTKDDRKRDVGIISEIDSKYILSYFLSGELSVSNLSKSIHFFEISKGGFSVQDRIDMLIKYHNIMESINPTDTNGTLKIFRWERDASFKDRPYSSNISADYLFQFQVKGSPYPYMNFFFKDEGSGHLAGISCFPSTQDYSIEKRIMKDGTIKKYSLAEAAVLTITETSRDNSDILLKTMTAEERKSVQDRLDEAAFGKFVKDIIKDLKDKRTSVDIRLEKFLENKNDRYNDTVLNMVKSRLNQSLGTAPEDKKERIFYCVEQIDSILKLRQIIRDLPALREKAYHSEAEMDRYLEADTELMEQLDNIGKCEYAVKELNQQISGTNDSEVQALIKEEAEKIKEKWSRFNELEIQPRSMNIEFNLNAPKIQGSDMVAVMEHQKVFSMQIPLPPKKPFRALWQKIQKFGDYLKEKVSEIFGKKADAEPDKTNTETVLQQKAPAPHYSLESKNKEIVVHFMEDSGFCTEQNKDYFSVLSVMSVTEPIIRDVTGVQAERQIPEEKKVREVIQIGEEQETSPAPERQSYEYER